MAHLRGHTKSDKVIFQLLDEKAEAILEELLRLHEHGCMLHPYEDNGLKYVADSGMKCSERAEALIVAMGWKLVVTTCLGRDGSIKTVNAPHWVLESKKRNEDSNRTRAKNANMLVRADFPKLIKTPRDKRKQDMASDVVANEDAEGGQSGSPKKLRSRKGLHRNYTAATVVETCQDIDAHAGEVIGRLARVEEMASSEV